MKGKATHRAEGQGGQGLKRRYRDLEEGDGAGNGNKHLLWRRQCLF
jgi:hypothetical protein